jgi:ABC-2 type transport system permease protein
MQRFTTLTQSIALINLRNRRLVLFSILIPLLMMVLLNEIFQSNTKGVEGISISAFTLSGVIIIVTMSNGLIGNAHGLTSWRELGVLRRLQATSLPVWQLIIAYLLNQFFITLLGIVVLSIIAELFFKVQIALGSIALAIGFILLGILVFQTAGQLLSSLVADANTATTIGQAVYIVLLFLSNLVIPTAQFPPTLHMIVKWFPSSLLVDVLRPPLLLDKTSPQTGLDLLCLGAYLIVFIITGSLLFRWEKKP